jgi:hypothetical protein
MAGELVAVRIPTPAEEGLRDLVRAREDVRMDLTRCRHRLGKQLLRHGVRFEGPGENWTRRHLEWLARVQPPDRAAHAALVGYLDAVQSLMIRRDRLGARSPRWSRRRRGRRMSRVCAACAASTRSARSGCASRSATSGASSGPAG